MPTPLLQAEVEPWLKAPTAAAFPLHPAGVTNLYDRAQHVLAVAEAYTQLDVGERPTLNRECWRISCILYTPGGGIRAAMDRVLEDRAVRPNLTGVRTDDEKLRLMQLAHLAAWAVFRACGDLSRQAK